MAGLRGGCRFILKEYDIEKSLFGYVLPDRDFYAKIFGVTGASGTIFV